MKKIFQTLLIALVALGGFSTNALAQSDAEYAAAMEAIQDGQTYRVYTEFEGKTYYLRENGYLTENEKQAFAFTFTKVEAAGTLYQTGINLGKKFTNPTLTSYSTGDVVNNGHINIGYNDRNDWERQVFFNRNDFYAIRSTNANSAYWGANTYWTVLDNDEDNLPEADYSLEASYVWHIEQFEDGRPAAFEQMATWAYSIQQVYGLVQHASQYSSNAKESSEGFYEALLDNTFTTFFLCYEMSSEGS
mgnify:CR=1 FL=1